MLGSKDAGRQIKTSGKQFHRCPDTWTSQETVLSSMLRITPRVGITEGGYTGQLLAPRFYKVLADRGKLAGARECAGLGATVRETCWITQAGTVVLLCMWARLCRFLRERCVRNAHEAGRSCEKCWVTGGRLCMGVGIRVMRVKQTADRENAAGSCWDAGNTLLIGVIEKIREPEERDTAGREKARDKVFNFMAGLKPWAQAELRRRGIKDLAEALRVADGDKPATAKRDTGPVTCRGGFKVLLCPGAWKHRVRWSIGLAFHEGVKRSSGRGLLAPRFHKVLADRGKLAGARECAGLGATVRETCWTTQAGTDGCAGNSGMREKWVPVCSSMRSEGPGRAENSRESWKLLEMAGIGACGTLGGKTGQCMKSQGGARWLAKLEGLV
ncbi:OLC1v1005643C1 [Oldenlandia corymbosa var. corymbosa]|uniref:OLC1v1005643C1 n=1 Tax=Oldenlandia corymbosa var. corymbosa TaxID=529605 RepID=A0AAV1DF38_OLDCO|nr:OLC1v1005643C1 [Oldenlandia corymbosa var. corymbosa]